MLQRIPSLIAATITSVSVLVLVQGGGAMTGAGTGTSSANTGGSAPSGMGSANPVRRCLQEWGRKTPALVQT